MYQRWHGPPWQANTLAGIWKLVQAIDAWYWECKGELPTKPVLPDLKWNICSPGWKSMLSNSRQTASSILNSRSHANRKIVFRCWTEYWEMVLSVKLLTYLTTPQQYSPIDNSSVARHNTYSLCMSSSVNAQVDWETSPAAALVFSSPIMSCETRGEQVGRP